MSRVTITVQCDTYLRFDVYQHADAFPTLSSS